MAVDDQELRAIAFLAQRIRRSTSGAGPWDDEGLISNLRKIQNRNLHHVIEHVIRHAADPKAKNPGVLAGSFTPGPPEMKPGRAEPPRREDECQMHPGQWANNCGGCRADELAALDEGESAPSRRRSRPVPAQTVPAYVAARNEVFGQKAES